MSDRSWSVGELLGWTRDHFTSIGIETARLDAECLLAFALGTERMRLYIDFEKPVMTDERSRFRDLVRQRAQERIPVAQLTGEKEFWSLPFRVTRDVLVPRPETETLVSAALEFMPETEGEYQVLDLGTGSGAVALALAKERPKARVLATDISAAALGIARDNAQRLGLEDRVQMLEGSLFEPLGDERFDVVVSNPPYLCRATQSQLAPELAHEPEGALFAGEDGLAVVRPLVAQVQGFLAAGAWVALELGENQSEPVRALMLEAGLCEPRVFRDLASSPRVLAARNSERGEGEWIASS